MAGQQADRQSGSRAPIDSTADDRSPTVEGFAWYVHATTVAGEMVGPGVLGIWLDNYFGTGSVLAVIGFGLGMVLGIWHLVRLSKLSSGPMAGSSRAGASQSAAGSRNADSVADRTKHGSGAASSDGSANE